MSKQKLFIGCKLIKAETMSMNDFGRKVKGTTPADNDPDADGYLVIYPDGYKSWSPKDVFETAYREVVRGEVELFRETDTEMGQTEGDC